MLDMILADSPINIVEEIKNESISPRLDRKLNRNNDVLSGRTDSVWEILIVYKLQTRNANFRLNLQAQTMLLISRSLELFQDSVWEPLGKMLINKTIINYIDRLILTKVYQGQIITDLKLKSSSLAV